MNKFNINLLFEKILFIKNFIPYVSSYRFVDLSENVVLGELSFLEKLIRRPALVTANDAIREMWHLTLRFHWQSGSLYIWYAIYLFIFEW